MSGQICGHISKFAFRAATAKSTWSKPILNIEVRSRRNFLILRHLPYVSYKKLHATNLIAYEARISLRTSKFYCCSSQHQSECIHCWIDKFQEKKLVPTWDCRKWLNCPVTMFKKISKNKIRQLITPSIHIVSPLWGPILARTQCVQREHKLIFLDDVRTRFDGCVACLSVKSRPNFESVFSSTQQRN